MFKQTNKQTNKQQNRFRATVCKYGESDDRSENADFLLLRQKDLFGELFLEIYFEKVQIKKIEYRIISQDGRWNLCKIAHFQQASTERSELAWISYSHNL